ncbi:MAG: hypothetical protein PSX79_09185 [bacterium]|nr:hypothetical protein [bacterium]
MDNGGMMVRGRSIWLASLIAAVLAAGGAWAQTSPAGGGTALLRINCEGDSAGADVTLNDEFKGACPIDVSVPAGTVRLRALKSEGELRERVLEQEFRIGSGVVKKIELEMPASQLNARGQRLEEARIQEEQARKRQAAEEQRRLAEAKALEDTRKAAASAEQLAQVPIQLAKNVDAMLKARRVVRGTEGLSCPDCVAEFVGSDGVKADFPTTTTDKAFKLLLERPKANALRYLATNGAEFRPPAVAAPLPCESAVDTMRKLTPLVGYSELSPLEQAGKDRAHPKEPRQYIRDAKIWPVAGTCVNGSLEGPLEFWMFGNQVWGDRDAG